MQCGTTFTKEYQMQVVKGLITCSDKYVIFKIMKCRGKPKSYIAKTCMSASLLADQQWPAARERTPPGTAHSQAAPDRIRKQSAGCSDSSSSSCNSGESATGGRGTHGAGRGPGCGRQPEPPSAPHPLYGRPAGAAERAVSSAAAPPLPSSAPPALPPLAWRAAGAPAPLSARGGEPPAQYRSSLPPPRQLAPTLVELHSAFQQLRPLEPVISRL